MRIKRVHVENFRCLKKVDIAFDRITCFVGPTGAGKSTVLRALDWFFNGERSVALGDEDLHSAADGRRITVEVEFDALTPRDRESLGSYAPPDAETVIIWRTWEDGEDRITGKGLAYPPFEAVREQPKAMAKRTAYRELREQRPDLGLPAAGSEEAVLEALRLWELDHRDQLSETEIPGTHFFGFAGQSKLAELIDFVFVSADLRAHEEADDQKTSTVGRILDHAVDRTVASKQLDGVEEAAHRQRQEIHARVYGPVLDGISRQLSREVAQFTTGRQVLVSPVVQAPRPARTTFRISIRDGAAETSVHRQGHGFQRALIIAALKLLAERRRPQDGERTLCLAVEEPELFQHPAQARTFAEVLRRLAASSGGGVQVMYATHSFVFVDHRSYHEIRRLGQDFVDGHPVTRVRSVTEADLCRLLDLYVKADDVRRRTGSTCTGTLAEAFFAKAAVLVEGDTDAAVVTGCAERQGANLGAEGISVIDVNGKGNLILCHAILTALGVRCHVVFDGDEGLLERKLESVRHLPEEEQRQKRKKFEEEADREARKNTALLGYLRRPSGPWPETAAEPTHTVFGDNLEVYLGGEWPSWEQRRRELVALGDGFTHKNTATYREAARTAEAGPPLLLLTLLENVRALARD
ncbi:ATP-dependent endonuclease [Streptacidiphilus sp. ASG 303]|uniref:ATP-dependent nuclease n=1 Tax=Streptacidiphilus sp. ASG 303 TaxID=2896847 RepID=UPI001E3FF336|nr:AAA family ATPase [Streptacidiphilus sp. ASG 303]MCD0483384.1 ATP-dependent endonuclease [Streptacidiphilus sp. ASG 303]